MIILTYNFKNIHTAHDPVKWIENKHIAKKKLEKEILNSPSEMENLKIHLKHTVSLIEVENWSALYKAPTISWYGMAECDWDVFYDSPIKKVHKILPKKNRYPTYADKNGS